MQATRQSLNLPVSLEQALEAQGDLLYRMALLLTDHEAAAERLLRFTLRRVAQAAPPTVDSTAMLRMLLATSQQQTRIGAWLERVNYLCGLHRFNLNLLKRLRRVPTHNTLYQAIHRLPLQQRQMLGLTLLAGYDLPRVARIGNIDIDQARHLLEMALTALAPVAGVDLPTTDPPAACVSMRPELMHPARNQDMDTAVGDHLAVCSACRAFERNWNEVTRRVEQTLRETLRSQTLPPALHTLPHGRSLTRTSWFRATGLLPLLVLLFIGGLVLPGFFQQAAHPTQSLPLEPVDPAALVQHALDQIDQPPTGDGVWFAQWEILWYFSDGSIAPLQANAWVDAQNPARHRLQLAHADGGAPYELQIGDGDRAFWYALHPTYYGSLYSDLFSITEPELVKRRMQHEVLAQTRITRLHTGAWDLGPRYLRQAAAAPNLRTLGQQRDGNHTVQIISFTGNSPLELPAVAPGAASRVTILLALDVESGQLRKVTELLGPANGEQASRVTWQFQHESWLSNTEQIEQVFDPVQAWTGQGTFARRFHMAPFDPMLVLIEQAQMLHLSDINDPYVWLPPLNQLGNAAVPGAERSLLYYEREAGTIGLTFIGTGRWLTISANTNIFIFIGEDEPTPLMGDAPDEQITIEPWTVALYAGKGERYHLKLWRQLPADQTDTTFGKQVIFAQQEIYASGYTRAEVLEVVKRLQPFVAP